VDIIIANMHWGQEYKLIQSREQENLSEFLANEGVDLIIGAHPHVIQPSKVVVDTDGAISNVIVYSLGNFISGMVAPNTDGGQMIKVTLKKTNDKVSIQSAEYTLIYRHKAREGNKVNYTIVPVSLAEKTDSLSTPAIELDEESYRKMRAFAKNARAVFDKHNVGIPEYKILDPSN
jgi:poly-gamma-glutamate synthesis protein (capsule biosynthesis protein)